MLNSADSFADKLERHRRVTTSRAAEYHRAYLNDCHDASVTLTESDAYAIWQGCVNAAETEYRLGLIR